MTWKPLLQHVNLPEAKALLHSLLADAYLAYYKKRLLYDRQAYHMKGAALDKIEEWSASNFAQRIFFHLESSCRTSDLSPEFLTLAVPVEEIRKRQHGSSLRLSEQQIHYNCVWMRKLFYAHRQTELSYGSYSTSREMFVNLSSLTKASLTLEPWRSAPTRENLKFMQLRVRKRSRYKWIWIVWSK